MQVRGEGPQVQDPGGVRPHETAPCAPGAGQWWRKKWGRLPHLGQIRITKVGTPSFFTLSEMVWNASDLASDEKERKRRD